MNIFYKILVLVFMGGFTGALGQAALLKEFISGFCQNEMLVMALCGIWMLGGAFAGLYMYDTFYKNRDYKTIMLNLAFIPVINAFVLPAMLVLVRYLKQLLGFSAQTLPPGLIDTALAAIPVMALPGAMLALIFALASDVLRREKSLPNVKVLFLAEAAGFMMAGMLYTLFFSGRWGNLEILYRFGLVNIATAYVLFREKNKEGRYVIAVLIFVLIGYLSIDMTGALKNINDASLKAVYGAQKTVEVKELAGSRFAVAGEKGDYQFYQDGVNVYSAAQAEYIDAANRAVKSAAGAASVLVINSAYSGILDALKKAGTVRDITVIEADADFGEQVSKYSPVTKDGGKNIKIILGDPFVYFTKMKPEAKYNLVLISQPGPGVLSKDRFASDAFKKMLAPYLAANAAVKYMESGKEAADNRASLHGKNLLKFSLIGIFLILTAWLGFGIVRQQAEFVSSLRIMTCGAVAFAAAAAVIFEFQTVYGTLYKDFAMLAGFFMFGAALSTVLSNMFKLIKIHVVMYLGALLSLVLMLILSYFAKQGGAPDYNFSIFALLLSGIFFGLCFNTLAKDFEPVKLYGFNLLGGAVGALATALLLYAALGALRLLALCAVVSFVAAVLSAEKKNG